jgi:hypothetical protein
MSRCWHLLLSNISSRMNKQELWILLIAYIIELPFIIMALTWIHKLEEISCKCSDNWMRTYIKYFLYILFVKMIVSIIIHIYPKGIYAYYRYFSLIFNVVAFANLIIVIIYIDELKTMNCVCSEDIRREVYWYYNIVALSLIVCIYLIIFMMLVYFWMLLKS